MQPSNPCVVTGLLKSLVILCDLIPKVQLVHTRGQITMGSVVKLVGPFLEIKNDTAMVNCVSRLELDRAFVDVAIRDLPYLIRKRDGSDQCLAYIESIVASLFNCSLEHVCK